MDALRKALATVVVSITLWCATGAAAAISSETRAPEPKTWVAPEGVVTDRGTPAWVASGSFLPDGKPVGLWVLPDGYQFRGTQDLSEDQVFDWADRLRREGEESAVLEAPAVQRQASNSLSGASGENALAASALAALVSLFAIVYLYRTICGGGAVTKARKYAAIASISSAPLCMAAFNALLIGLMGPGMLASFDSATFSRMIGLAIWAAIITGIGYSCGWVVDNRTRVTAIAASQWQRTGEQRAHSGSTWVWLTIAALLMLGYCSGGRDGTSADGCHVEWDGRANPTVCD